MELQYYIVFFLVFALATLGSIFLKDLPHEKDN